MRKQMQRNARNMNNTACQPPMLSQKRRAHTVHFAPEEVHLQKFPPNARGIRKCTRARNSFEFAWKNAKCHATWRNNQHCHRTPREHNGSFVGQTALVPTEVRKTCAKTTRQLRPNVLNSKPRRFSRSHWGFNQQKARPRGHPNCPSGGGVVLWRNCCTSRSSAQRLFEPFLRSNDLKPKQEWNFAIKAEFGQQKARPPWKYKVPLRGNHDSTQRLNEPHSMNQTQSRREPSIWSPGKACRTTESKTDTQEQQINHEHTPKLMYNNFAYKNLRFSDPTKKTPEQLK